MFYYNVEDYMKEYNICLALKAIWDKPYSNFQFLLVSIYY